MPFVRDCILTFLLFATVGLLAGFILGYLPGPAWLPIIAVAAGATIFVQAVEKLL